LACFSSRAFPCTRAKLPKMRAIKK
jgi:hypothetical protein